ncbi:MAG: PKD domain-containing protein [Bacteroidota bacterium]
MKHLLLFLLLLGVHLICQAQCDASFSVTDSISLQYTRFEPTGGLIAGTNHFWDFGDGNTSTMGYPFHAFQTDGVKHICHIVSTASCTDTVCRDIFFRYPCLDSLPAVLGEICQINMYGDSVRFWYMRIPNDFLFRWSFGDGTYSTAYMPGHRYDSSGVYDLELIVTSIDSMCIDTLRQQIEVGSALSQYELNFSYEQTGYFLEFSDSTIYQAGAPVFWQWAYYVDGNYLAGISYSSEEPPPVFFHCPGPGTYEVCYEAWIYTRDTIRYCETITIDAIDCFAQFSLIEYDVSFCQEMGIQLMNESTFSGKTLWEWDFGDSTTAYVQSPPDHSYFYYCGFKYLVCLTATNIEGCQDKYCDIAFLNIGSADRLEDLELEVYPNPTEAAITIEFEQPKFEEIQLRLLDIHGKSTGISKVFIPGRDGPSLKLDLSSLLPGIYFLQFSLDGKHHVERILKQ